MCEGRGIYIFLIIHIILKSCILYSSLVGSVNYFVTPVYIHVYINKLVCMCYMKFVKIKS